MIPKMSYRKNLIIATINRLNINSHIHYHVFKFSYALNILYICIYGLSMLFQSIHHIVKPINLNIESIFLVFEYNRLRSSKKGDLF